MAFLQNLDNIIKRNDTLSTLRKIVMWKLGNAKHHHIPATNFDNPILWGYVENVAKENVFKKKLDLERNRNCMSVKGEDCNKKYLTTFQKFMI